MNNPLGVSPSNRKQGTTRGKEKRSRLLFSLPRVVPCFPLLGLTPSGLFMDLSSTLIYTSELILCSTICVPSATRHYIHIQYSGLCCISEASVLACCCCCCCSSSFFFRYVFMITIATDWLLRFYFSGTVQQENVSSKIDQVNYYCLLERAVYPSNLGSRWNQKCSEAEKLTSRKKN